MRRLVDSKQQLVQDPRSLAVRWLGHNRLAASPDADDIISDLLYGIARGIATYRPDGGKSLVNWCWTAMDSEFLNGRRRRAIHEARRELAPPDADPEWLDVEVIDPGYRMVDNRMTLQRWADMAHLTDAQADLLAWMAVHGGTYAQRTGTAAGHKSLFSEKGGYSTMKAGLAKLQRVAITGRPWAPTPGRQVRCGTESGYQMHRRRGEVACHDCLAARREAYRRRKDARAQQAIAS